MDAGNQAPPTKMKEVVDRSRSERGRRKGEREDVAQASERTARATAPRVTKTRAADTGTTASMLVAGVIVPALVIVIVVAQPTTADAVEEPQPLRNRGAAGVKRRSARTRGATEAPAEDR